MINMSREIAAMTSSAPLKLNSKSKSKFPMICNLTRKGRIMKSNDSQGTTFETSVIVNAKVALTTLPQYIFNIQLILPFLLVLAFASGLITVNGLKCYMCGQYNEGVGSITPCLNYSEKHQYLYLKECSKKSEKYCVKYVSELSIVRDCATECVEKEIWETQTYCCTEDGCNGSMYLQSSNLMIILPILCYFIRLMFNVQKRYR